MRFTHGSQSFKYTTRDWDEIYVGILSFCGRLSAKMVTDEDLASIYSESLNPDTHGITWRSLLLRMITRLDIDQSQFIRLFRLADPYRREGSLPVPRPQAQRPEVPHIPTRSDFLEL